MSQPRLFEAAPFAGYTYSYPHKTSYRPLDPRMRLDEIWARQPRDALFLYLHVPFCLAKCGYCNLFSMANVPTGMIDDYLSAIRRQAHVVRRSLSDVTFVQLALGGGTPSVLDCRQLDALLSVAVDVMGADPASIPTTVEVSPETSTREKIKLIRKAGISRLSVGVQTFDPLESRLLGRRQAPSSVHGTLEAARECGFETLNIDLIYGGPGQSLESWRRSVMEAVRYQPEELYLYPLYVRPLTGLARWERTGPDDRLAAYRLARSLLLETGYRQVSMRMFRSARALRSEGPAYRCQDDGMIGLGCGPRSYTTDLHYSSRYAVTRGKVQGLIREFLTCSDADFGYADHGIWLDREDRCRRFVLQSILRREGLDRSHYWKRFGCDVLRDLPQLRDLEAAGFVQFSNEAIRLNERGIELSDAIGPWLYSERVRNLMESYSWQ